MRRSVRWLKGRARLCQPRVQEGHRPASGLLALRLWIRLKPLLQEAQGCGVQCARPSVMPGFRQPRSPLLLPGGSPVVDARQATAQRGSDLLWRLLLSQQRQWPDSVATAGPAGPFSPHEPGPCFLAQLD